LEFPKSTLSSALNNSIEIIRISLISLLGNSLNFCWNLFPYIWVESNLLDASEYLFMSQVFYLGSQQSTRGSIVAVSHWSLACTWLHTLLLDHVPTLTAPVDCSLSVAQADDLVGIKGRRSIGRASCLISSRHLFVLFLWQFKASHALVS
jgi:hypothetical protein